MDRKATTLTTPSAAGPSLAIPAPGTLLRYAVLHHTGVLPEHFDLLLEPPHPPNQPLLTWRIALPPTLWSPDTPATRQPDQRPLYMTYEGEISHNRGRVQRIASGTATVLAPPPQALNTLHVELSGDLHVALNLPV
jgi:hypothetical protein